MEYQQGEITVLLVKWREGEAKAFEDLMPLVYPTLPTVLICSTHKIPHSGLIFGVLEGAFRVISY
jgi:hypothetical protein